MPKGQTNTEISRLKADLLEGRVSRRSFLEGATALGLSATLASSIMSEARAAEPQKGGHLRAGMGHGSTTDSLDPATYENGFMSNGICYGSHNHIAELGVSGKLEPELAESWEASDDAATWFFKIRKDVEFHNGKTVDADDVVASVNHHRGEDSKSAAKPLLEQVTGIKADGKDTVVVELSGGNADFPFIISDYHVAIMPSKDGVADWQSGVGAGGYAVKSFNPGVKAELTRHPNYWKSDRAHFDSVELLSITDVVARTNALATGEIDVMDRCDIKTLHLLERNPNVKVGETTGTAHYSIPMRTDTAPFDNNDVRLALKYALDREALLQTVLRGHGALGNDHPISTANRYHASEAELPQKTYDPDKAKFHLKQAGLTELTVPLHAADAAFGGAVDAAVLYKEHAGKTGITIDVVREPNDGYWSNVWMNKPWCMCYWGGRPTEDWMFSTAYAEGASWNDSFWKNDRFNKLLVEARAVLNEEKRRGMYVELQKIVSDEGGVVVPLFNNYIFAMAKNVDHGPMQGNWDLDGGKFAERWWFSS